jgi:hypothetical protein
MSKIHYTNCDISLNESSKSILINPVGKRFYFVPCEDQNSIFTNATLTLDDEGRYVIEGTQLLYNEHNGVSLSYEKLLCEHPHELIIKRTFLGLTWYKVKGIMKREVRSRYICKHNTYQIHERLEFLSHTYLSEV